MSASLLSASEQRILIPEPVERSSDVRRNDKMRTSDVIRTARCLKLRNPFTMVHSPITVKAYIRAHQNRDRWSWKFFELSRRVPFFSEGKASVNFGATTKDFYFNAANTQFHSIYLDKYRFGYESETCLLLELLLRDTDIFYDIGSNWGHLSIYVASIPDFRGHIHAFEPTSESFRDLECTVQQLKLDTQISCHKVACSDAMGVAQMVVDDRLHSGLAHLSDLKGGTAVTVISLDECNLAPPQVLKMDVEGAEYRVLRGGRRLIETARPFIIFEAWPGTTTRMAGEILRDLEYKLFFPCLTAFHADGIGYTVLAYGETPEADNVHLTLFPWEIEYRNLFGDWFNAFACPVEKIEWLRGRFASA